MAGAQWKDLVGEQGRTIQARLDELQKSVEDRINGRRLRQKWLGQHSELVLGIPGDSIGRATPVDVPAPTASYSDYYLSNAAVPPPNEQVALPAAMPTTEVAPVSDPVKELPARAAPAPALPPPPVGYAPDLSSPAPLPSLRGLKPRLPQESSAKDPSRSPAESSPLYRPLTAPTERTTAQRAGEGRPRLSFAYPVDLPPPPQPEQLPPPPQKQVYTDFLGDTWASSPTWPSPSASHGASSEVTSLYSPEATAQAERASAILSTSNLIDTYTLESRTKNIDEAIRLLVEEDAAERAEAEERKRLRDKRKERILKHRSEVAYVSAVEREGFLKSRFTETIAEEKQMKRLRDVLDNYLTTSREEEFKNEVRFKTSHSEASKVKTGVGVLKVDAPSVSTQEVKRLNTDADSLSVTADELSRRMRLRVQLRDWRRNLNKGIWDTKPTESSAQRSVLQHYGLVHSAFTALASQILKDAGTDLQDERAVAPNPANDRYRIPEFRTDDVRPKTRISRKYDYEVQSDYSDISSLPAAKELTEAQQEMLSIVERQKQRIQREREREEEMRQRMRQLSGLQREAAELESMLATLDQRAKKDGKQRNVTRHRAGHDSSDSDGGQENISHRSTERESAARPVTAEHGVPNYGNARYMDVYPTQIAGMAQGLHTAYLQHAMQGYPGLGQAGPNNSSQPSMRAFHGAHQPLQPQQYMGQYPAHPTAATAGLQQYFGFVGPHMGQGVFVKPLPQAPVPRASPPPGEPLPAEAATRAIDEETNRSHHTVSAPSPKIPTPQEVPVPSVVTPVAAPTVEESMAHPVVMEVATERSEAKTDVSKPSRKSRSGRNTSPSARSAAESSARRTARSGKSHRSSPSARESVRSASDKENARSTSGASGKTSPRSGKSRKSSPRSARSLKSAKSAKSSARQSDGSGTRGARSSEVSRSTSGTPKGGEKESSRSSRKSERSSRRSSSSKSS